MRDGPPTAAHGRAARVAVDVFDRRALGRYTRSPVVSSAMLLAARHAPDDGPREAGIVLGQWRNW